MSIRTLVAGAALCLGLCSPVLAQPPAQVLKYLGRHTATPAVFEGGAAEVVAWDAASKTVVFINAAKNAITFLNATNPAAMTVIRDVSLAPYNGAANSVAIRNGSVAVALEDASSKQNSGRVVFFDMAGTFKAQYTVGALPDMLTFTPDGTRVVVCNEGEPNSAYTNDPEGSVSIINVSAGVTSATVQTVRFTALNGKQDSLRAMGIRIYGPNATVAQDFEPEYAAISSDSKTAYVTIQEANAMAIIDIPTATLTRVVPFGYKDYSKGLPRVTKYPWTNRPELGTTSLGQRIELGGMSGLCFLGFADGDTNRVRFLSHPDRGPNAEPVVLRGQPRRPFALPYLQSEVDEFELNTQTGAITVVNRTRLFRRDGNDSLPISGRPNLQSTGQGLAYTDEYGVDLFGNDIPNDPFGADLEGIVVDAAGTWWMVDEYRPAIYHFLPSGELVARYVPAGTAAAVGAPANAFGVEAIPSDYARRRANRGFEAVAIEGDILYAFIQSGIDSPDSQSDNTSKATPWCRVLAFNTITKQAVGEYLYPMFEKFGSADKIGDAVSLGNKRFYVVERDDATGLRARKYIHEINLTGATNLLTAGITLPAGRTIESMSFAELAALGIRPVTKKKAVYLPGVGYGDYDKVEGLARISDTRYLLVNDNDFGVGGSVLADPPNGTITINTANIPVFGLLSFDRPNGLDGSDRDSGVGNNGAVRIRTWPVYGMYEPDAIATFTAGGQTYLVTANEGDAREYDAIVEEARVSSLTLDAAAFPNGSTLKSNTGIGRLNVTNTMGDLDGDGDYDELYTLGGRSFTIWNVDGNLIWDSGNEFETRTAAFYPGNFNAGHTTNALDDRSDNKGPEPEAITVGTINDSTYVFIGLERMGHTFMYNVTDPTKARYVDYINTRNFGVAPNLANVANGTVGDLGCEVLTFVPATESPTGGDMVIAGNEISGTVSAFSVRIPRLNTVPGATVNVCLTDTLVLRVGALGATLSYQWEKDGIAIVGATSATYRTTASTVNLGGTYRCRVTADGGMAITTPPSVVTVSPFPRTRILTEPPAVVQTDNNTGVRIGFTATSASNETYRWFRNGTSLAEGTKYRGVTTNTLFINDVQLADTSSRYYCVVTGGCSSAQTRNVAVLIPRVLFTRQPDDVVACPGDTIVLETSAAPTGGDKTLFYRWRKGETEFLTEGGRYVGVNSPRLRITGARPEDSGRYICVIEGLPSRFASATRVATVAVDAAPRIVANLATVAGDTVATLCDGRSVQLRLATEGVVSAYAWYRDGVLVTTTQQPTFAPLVDGTYSVRIVGGCSTITVDSRPIRIVRAVRPAVGLQPAPEQRVVEGNPMSLSFTIAAGTAELSYQWFRNDTLLPGRTSAILDIAQVNLDDAGVYVCRITNVCGQTYTERALVRVSPKVVSSVDDADGTAADLVVGPNPFDASTTIAFTTTAADHVVVTVIDAVGRDVVRLVDAILPVGPQRVALAASQLPASGTYTVQVRSGGRTMSIPVVAVR